MYGPYCVVWVGGGGGVRVRTHLGSFPYFAYRHFRSSTLRVWCELFFRFFLLRYSASLPCLSKWLLCLYSSLPVFVSRLLRPNCLPFVLFPLFARTCFIIFLFSVPFLGCFFGGYLSSPVTSCLRLSPVCLSVRLLSLSFKRV